MAEEVPLRHYTRDPDQITSYDGQGSSNDVQNSSSARASTGSLPLRQARKLPAVETRIYDVTDKFMRACGALDIGQLVKDEYFTLFESIGAIEIMDAKMDSGFLQPGETLEDDYDPLAPLLPEELIGIMDQLLCYEMAWHTGYPLSQTLFTSVYIDKLLWPEPKALMEAQFYRGDTPDAKRAGTLLEVLRAYCLALIKGCDFVIAKITGRDYFEEEDFCTHTYNRVLLVQVPLDVFLREMDAALELMEDDDLEINHGLRSAIITRLQFRKDFLCALDLENPLDDLSKSWPPVLNHVAALTTTHQMGKPVPGSFSTKIQRRLASTVPPRPIVELDFKDASEKLKQLCVDCEEATRFTSLPLDPLEYQSFLWAFASRSPAPLPYSRSYLANILFHPDIINAPISLPLVDVKTLVFPATSVLDPSNWAVSPPRNALLPKPPRLQLALLIDEFIERVGQPYLDLWVTLGQNRCRLRRMLTHVITGWDMLQAEANFVDADLLATTNELDISHEMLPNPLSTWVYVKKLWMIEKIILLGFEQDIYLPDEFAAMYYFLSTISAKRKDALERCVQHAHSRTEQLVKAGKYLDAADVESTTPYLDSELHQAAGISAFSLALHKFYTLLIYLRVLAYPTRPPSTESLRYELRMKPFFSLQPPEVLEFSAFQTSIQPYGSYASPSPSFHSDVRNPESALWTDLDACLKVAKDSFAKVKKIGAKKSKAEGVEQAWNKEIQGMLASCVALGIAVAVVKSAARDAGPGLRVGVRLEVPGIGTGKRYSEGWVVGKVGMG